MGRNFFDIYEPEKTKKRVSTTKIKVEDIEDEEELQEVEENIQEDEELQEVEEAEEEE